MPFANDFKTRKAGGPYYDMGNSFYLDDKEELHSENDHWALKTDNGDTGWYQHGEPHRIGAPAIIRADGGWEYFENGQCHREGAPAVHRADGTDEYWTKGRKLDEMEVKALFDAAAAKTDRAIGAAVVQDLGKGLPVAVKPMKALRFGKQAL